MHLHIENFNDASVLAFFVEAPDQQRPSVDYASTIKKYLTKSPSLSGGFPKIAFDFKCFCQGIEGAGHRWFADENHMFIEIAGCNASKGANWHFNAIVTEASQLVQRLEGSKAFDLMCDAATHELKLNRYNVLMSLSGDYNRAIIFSFSDRLSKIILEAMVDAPIEKGESQLLKRESIAEIANIVMGLSLKHLDHQQLLALSTPMFLDAKSQPSRLIKVNVPVQHAICRRGDFQIYGINF